MEMTEERRSVRTESDRHRWLELVHVRAAAATVLPQTPLLFVLRTAGNLRHHTQNVIIPTPELDFGSLTNGNMPGLRSVNGR